MIFCLHILSIFTQVFCLIWMFAAVLPSLRSWLERLRSERQLHNEFFLLSSQELLFWSKNPETVISLPSWMFHSDSHLSFFFPVIDLLAALNLSQHRGGVSRLQTSGSIMYKVRPRAAHLILPQEYSHRLHSSFQGNMGVHLVGRQALRSRATVFSLSSTSSPILQIISSTLDDTLQLILSGGRAPVSFVFPKANPLSGGIWVQLAVSLEPDRLVFFVKCEDAVILPIKSENRVDWELPGDVVIALGSIPENDDSKFNVRFLCRRCMYSWRQEKKKRCVFH